MKVILFFLLFLIPLSALCGNESPRSRYISIAPSTTEILFALGLDKEIVGVSSYCNYPPQAELKPKVGDFSHPNMEYIASLKPDYIFCTGLEQSGVIETLKWLNFKVYSADPVDMEGVFRTIEDIGRITGKDEEARNLTGAMRRDWQRLEEKVRVIPLRQRPRVFVEIWHNPLMSAGRGSFIDALIWSAGGINVAHDVIRPYSVFSAEEVVNLDPDCIIIAYMDRNNSIKTLRARFGWQDISAVKRNRVFNDIDPDIILRPGPRAVSGMEELYDRFFSRGFEKE